MRVNMRKDEGASLILVLILVLVLGVVLSALSGFSGTSVRNTIKFREVRSQNHALDAAVNGAIQRIRGDLTQGRAPGYTNGQNVCDDYEAATMNAVTIT